MGCLSAKSRVTPAQPRRNTEISIRASNLVSANKGSLPSDYRITKTLGAGAFAQVKLCEFSALKLPRAVKFIRKSGLHSQQMDPTLFLKEVKILKTLDHPNILRCFEIYEDSKSFYVVTEYCEGGELFDKLIERKRFNEADAGNIMHQLLSAVLYCHERLIIHRDLKPENILLEDKSDKLEIKVADFGSSAVIDGHQRLSGCFGSAYYVAPEVLKGEYNEKCDIWSCGVLMYILLTGKPPYPGTDERKILELVKHRPLQITELPGVSSAAVDLLQRMLTVNIKQRVSAKQAVNHPWIVNLQAMESPAPLSSALTNLRNFNSSAKLRDAVHVYLATQVVSREDLAALKQSFRALDKDSDGKISTQELYSGYSTIMGQDDAKQEVNTIMSKVDTDNSGDIDYAEFITACMDYEKYLSNDNLLAAFKLFDKDGSGDITAEELRHALAGGELYEDSVWQEIIAEVDQNGDGVIDLKEFLGLMTKLNS